MMMGKKSAYLAESVQWSALSVAGADSSHVDAQELNQFFINGYPTIPALRTPLMVLCADSSGDFLFFSCSFGKQDMRVRLFAIDELN